MRPARAWIMVGLCLPVALALTGCSGEKTSGSEDGPSARTTPAPPPPTAPRVGSCHDLRLAEATAPVDTKDPVPCARTHTSVTYRTGRLDLVRDGHLLAVDSRAVRRQLAGACATSLRTFLGGSPTQLRLSRFEPVWFGPSLEQADKGATWYRCDVVVVHSKGKLLPLPRRVQGTLARPGALDRFGTCGTSAPGRKGFERVLCSERHSWRAIDVVAMDPDARYLGKAATSAGDAACEDQASARAGDALRFSWSFEWPTREQWSDGQRHGLCWVPEA